jgi:cytochrome P450
MSTNDDISGSKERGSNQEDPSNTNIATNNITNDNPNNNANNNHNHAFVAIFGLVAASVGSTVLHLYRMDHPGAFPRLPQVTYAHSVGLCVTSMCIMMLFIYHSLSTLKLLALEMPVIPSPLPYLGHGIRFMQTSPWDLLLRWHKQCGAIFCFPLMGRTVVSIASPSFLKLVLQSKIRNVKKDVGFSYQPFLVILGNGIVTSEGHAWMTQRLKMSTALRKDVLDMIPHVTLQAVQRLCVHLDAAAASNTAVDLSEALRHLTLQVISKAFLSLTADESDATFATMYLPIVDECNTRVWHPWRSACVLMPFWWMHQYHVYRLDSYVARLIQQRWKDGVRKHDMLDIVMGDAWDQKVLTSATIRQIRDEMKTFLLAGHETSAAMMTWAFYEMMNSDTLMKEVCF